MRQLLLLTTSFPFGNGEDFLTEELRRASGFDGVVICACHAGQEAEQTKPVPSGMHVIRLRAEPSSVSYASIPLHPEMWSEALRVLFRGRSVSGRLHELAFFRRKVQAVFAALQRQVSSFLPADEIVIYSYWFYDAAMAGALFAEKLRAQGKTVRLISRAHGFDAFPERSPYQYLPFRRFLLNRYDAVRPCSPAAARAVRDAYSARAKKVRVSFLGTVDHGCPFGSRGPVFHVVSCSYLVPVKRLTLLMEALGKTTIPVRWTHIGGGPQEAEIRAAAQTLPENVQWELTGPMPNEELMAFYGSTPRFLPGQCELQRRAPRFFDGSLLLRHSLYCYGGGRHAGGGARRRDRFSAREKPEGSRHCRSHRKNEPPARGTVFRHVPCGKAALGGQVQR